ncbi:MAG: CoA pyrophosphatase [Myxococcales bacterium]|nr:CoA pyrophosphatase [Myxococcales bacterium]
MPLQLDRIRERLAAHQPLTLDDSASPKRAAVSVILRDAARGSGPEVLLMRRAESPRDPWSGHMSFPGGRFEPNDGNLLATAQRETLEEVGLDLTLEGAALGRLDDLEAVARAKRVGMVIRPYVFEVPPDTRFATNHEVAELVWAPLPPMFAGERDAQHVYEFGGNRLQLPAFDVDGRVVWGLTYQMLGSFFRLLR